MKFSSENLKAGEIVRVSGQFFTLRDNSVKKLVDILKSGGKIPLDLSGAYAFFAAPTPGFRESRASIGPTTSARMAGFIPYLLDCGVRGFVGKGAIPDDAVGALRAHGGLYFQALGGVGAYYGSRVVDMRPLMFEELGPEAVFLVDVADFPLVISIDSGGGIFF